jgi:hypothetical protein
MKNCVTGLLMVLGPALLCLPPSPATAQTNSTAEDAQIAADDKEGCTRNLKVIYDAIQLYEIDHKDIPNWLSDLVPQYINDPNVLICPACKRTGQTEAGALADPKIPCSYLYEFCPVPLGKIDAPGDPSKTRRDWKRQQMALVGSVVPIVRCRHHAMTLNLSFDGHIYDSPKAWETLLTNRVNVDQLRPGRIFAAAVKAAAPLKTNWPARDPATKSGLIDLTSHYNAPLTESWRGSSNSNTAPLPGGLQNFAGVDYDVRGIVQLGSKSPAAKLFPAQVKGIKIQQKCFRLHFLHSTGFGSSTNEGQRVGSYILHFATNQMQLEIPIIYGRDVRNWRQLLDEMPATNLTVAQLGTNEASALAHHPIRVFATTWVNVAPDVEIESLDFVSAMRMPAPLLIAITAD